MPQPPSPTRPPSGEPYRCQFELLFDSYEEGRAPRPFKVRCGALGRVRVLGARETTTGLDWVITLIRIGD